MNPLPMNVVTCFVIHSIYEAGQENGHTQKMTLTMKGQNKSKNTNKQNPS